MFIVTNTYLNEINEKTCLSSLTYINLPIRISLHALKIPMGLQMWPAESYVQTVWVQTKASLYWVVDVKRQGFCSFGKIIKACKFNSEGYKHISKVPFYYLPLISCWCGLSLESVSTLSKYFCPTFLFGKNLLLGPQILSFPCKSFF